MTHRGSMCLLALLLACGATACRSGGRCCPPAATAGGFVVGAVPQAGDVIAPVEVVEVAGDGAVPAASPGFERTRPLSATYSLPGFEAYEEDGRLWVFRAGSPGLAEFHAVGEPAKSVTLIGEGPNGMTIRGEDRDDLKAYAAAAAAAGMR